MTVSKQNYMVAAMNNYTAVKAQIVAINRSTALIRQMAKEIREMK